MLSIPRILVAFLLLTSAAIAGPLGGKWIALDERTAQGEVGGVDVTASTNELAPFAILHPGRFAGRAWDAGDLALSDSTLGLGTTWVNGGDYQQFDFSAPWSGGYFYIENFDSSSQATISVTGGATTSLAAASSSVTYDEATGVLTSSNASFDGEGDAVIRLDGDVSSIRIDYSKGEQANGIFYAFGTDAPSAEDDGPSDNDDSNGGDTGGQPSNPAAEAVPEPSSLMLWGGLLLMVLAYRRRSN